VRYDEKYDERLTRIKFVTDGLLLREMMFDPLLLNYSVIMVRPLLMSMCMVCSNARRARIIHFPSLVTFLETRFETFRVRATPQVDEAHERSITTDLLLGLLKKIARKRTDLRHVHLRFRSLASIRPVFLTC
jgi:ATP-dependent RNA helicase DDX35